MLSSVPSVEHRLDDVNVTIFASFDIPATNIEEDWFDFRVLIRVVFGSARRPRQSCFSSKYVLGISIPSFVPMSRKSLFANFGVRISAIRCYPHWLFLPFPSFPM